jgi:hypothetical protein
LMLSKALFADFAVMCTWEGDNTVLSQQTGRRGGGVSDSAGRYLIQCHRKATAGEKVSHARARGGADFGSWEGPALT